MSEPEEYLLGATGTVVPKLALGQALGRYELVKLLGEGAMGQVFLARHALIGKEVALKVLRPELAVQGAAVRRFFQEARTVNQINHENIVQIFDFVQEPPLGMAPGRVYFVMEVVRGKGLTEWLRTGELTLAELVSMALQVAAALQAAHQVQVIHRDVKPDNIVVDRKESGGVSAKVLDFGVAKLSRTDARVVDTTQQGVVIGTPLYMSPEQASGVESDPRTDIYGLGAVLFEALSGHPPFQASSLGHLMAQVIRDTPPALPTQTRRGELIPPELSAVIQSCLLKDPSLRPQSMAELALRLSEAVPLSSSGIVQSRPFDMASTSSPTEGRPALGAGADLVREPSASGIRASPLPTAKTEPADGIEAVATARPPWRLLAVSAGAVVLLCGVGLGVHVVAAGTPDVAPPVIVAAVTPPPPAPVVAPEVSAPPPEAPPAPDARPRPPEPSPSAAARPAASLTGRASEALASTGDLAVVALRNGQPFFATVFLDGQRLGNSPILRAVGAGRHQVHLERAGFHSEDRSVTITAGRTSRLRVELAP